MFMIMFTIMITMMIAIIVMFLSSIISKKMIMDREKNTPFECGFEPFNSSRLPFSLNFFLIALIFLIFDVEIALMLPMIMNMKINNLMSWLSTSILFIMILIIGLYHEWNQGALEWSK